MEQVLEDKVRIASTGERIATGAGLFGVALAVGAVAFFNPVTAGFFPACPLYTATGIYCPGCGMTRGFHALFHGDVAGALDFNALMPIFAFVFGYFLLSTALIAVRGYGLSYKIFKPWMSYAFVAIAITFGILRNIPGYPFNILAP